MLSASIFSCSLSVFTEASLAMVEPVLSPVSIQLLFKEEEKRDSTRALDELTGAVQ